MGERLQTARKAAGYSSAAKAARALGVTESTYRAHENGQNEFSKDEAVVYGRKFKASPTYLLYGDGETIQAAVAVPPESGDVPQFNIHAGMGNGGLLSVMVDGDGLAIDPSDSDGFWTFPASVKAGHRNLRRTYAMPVTGDSMEPTLVGGAFVFVDTSHTVPSPPDIYAIDYGDGLMIKRIELVPQSELVRVISDNDRYRTYEMRREELRVYGRVIASFQWRG